MANDIVYHDKINYLDIDRHYMKEKLDNYPLTLYNILTTRQQANMFTKGSFVSMYQK